MSTSGLPELFDWIFDVDINVMMGYDLSDDSPGQKKRVEEVARFEFRLHPELKRQLCIKAVKEGVTVNSLMSQILAESIRKPELGIVPRKPPGRPPKIVST